MNVKPTATATQASATEKVVETETAVPTNEAAERPSNINGIGWVVASVFLVASAVVFLNRVKRK